MTNFISYIFGILAHLKLPKSLQTAINQKYIDFFGIDMSEFQKASDYENLSALFTRRFITPRILPNEPNLVISPCDGVIFQSGLSDDEKAFSIKGKEYDIKELLGDAYDKSEFEYMNFYLSPRDYHHYHAPCDMQILESFYIPAKLFSVAKKYLIKIPNLYAKNERVVLKCRLKNNKLIWLVFVGALNVGKIHFDFDPQINTNSFKKEKFNKKYENLFVNLGDHLGNFDLGSTVVLIAQKSALELDFAEEKNIKFAQILGKIKI